MTNKSPATTFCVVSHFEPNFTEPSQQTRASSNHLEAGEYYTILGDLNMASICCYYCCSVCADCSRLRFPRAMLCGWTRTP